MENYFDSVEFVSALSPLKEQFYKGNLDTNGDIIQYFVGIAIRYAQLISTTTTFTTEGLSKFLNQIATHLLVFLVEFVLRMILPGISMWPRC